MNGLAEAKVWKPTIESSGRVRWFDRLGLSATRAVTAVMIVLAHIALVIAVWQGATVHRAHEIAAITVQTLVEARPVTRVQAVAAPQLATFSPPSQPVPEVQLPPEPASTAISVIAAPVAAPAPPSPVHTALPSAGPPALPAMSEIAYLERPVPHYPAQSRRAREEGLVVLHVIIDEHGRVAHVEVQRSSGHPRLDEAAADAVAHALFRPYSEGGMPRAASAVIPIEFSLHAAAS